jgi:hypothetical protein
LPRENFSPASPVFFADRANALMRDHLSTGRAKKKTDRGKNERFFRFIFRKTPMEANPTPALAISVVTPRENRLPWLKAE